jgi:hypothetical protein
MNGTAVYGERVVIVQLNNGNVRLHTGRVSSTDSSHVYADNRERTFVCSERRFKPVSAIPEAHERSFKVSDIHLLKEREAQSLQDPKCVQEWFGTIYQDPLVTKIHRALKRIQAKLASPELRTDSRASIQVTDAAPSTPREDECFYVPSSLKC